MTSLHNVIALGSAEAIRSEKYEDLRGDSFNEGALLAGVDNRLLVEWAEDGASSPGAMQELYVQVLDMLVLSIEIAYAGKALSAVEKEWPGMIESYDPVSRTLYLLPKAQVRDYGELREEYRLQRYALQSA